MEEKTYIKGSFFVDTEKGLEADTTKHRMFCITPLPEISLDDEGKVLMVVNGKIEFVSLN